MLTKFETKSNRVKGLAFHPQRPWVMASLHNGSIQLWDYKLGTLVERFEEHEGPVRCVSFHHSQPLFVSGGDDYKIKVWNWKSNRSSFTLNGHLDYLRTTVFHHESPWILSSSDDQTIRIWNWQSRNCLAVLTGHSHYVMSAFFHPKDDLIVSCSLDQTVRVWDISGLRKKHAAGTRKIENRGQGGPGGQADVFGNMDCVVKYVLEGHARAVNWATFHPTLPLIISCGDDRLIKLWRMNDTKAWEVDTCRGHYNNVSVVLFHSRQDVIVSAAEDKTIRIWDMTKRTCLQTFRREHDRFWTLTSHPELNLFAAGHDSGIVVFKLERERPAFDIYQDNVFYVKEKSIRRFNFQTASDEAMVGIKRGHVGQSPPPHKLSYNPAENSVLLTTGKEESVFEIYQLPRNTSHASSESEPKRGTGSGAVFVARNRFAVQEKGKILIKDLSNTVTKELTPLSKEGRSIKIVDLFMAGGRNILITTTNSVILYDTEGRQVLEELAISGVRYVHWSSDQNSVALVSKHNLIIADKNLAQTCRVHETVKIKGGVWDDSGIFLYSTLNHIKYCLSNGDVGIIRTIEQPIYLLKVKKSSIYCLDRSAKVIVIPFDPTEYKFKTALIQRNYDEVFHLIKTSNLMGQSIIGYLQKKGYPEIALQFVKDPKTRFDLAIECGNVDAALEMAKVIDKEQYWQKLGVEALRQGNQLILEFVYQKTKNFDKLSFLYLITGNDDKLKKMLKIAEARKDTMSQYQNALYVGDVEEQVKILKESGQLSLAYLAAQTHGLYDEAASIVQLAGMESAPPILQNSQLAIRPFPILKQHDTNWPLLTVNKNVFDNAMKNTSLAAPPPDLDDADLENLGDWGDDDLDIDGDEKKNASPVIEDDDLGLDDEEGGWDIDAELDDILDEEGLASPKKAVAAFVPPKHGPSIGMIWSKNSKVAADHIAAGSFESAMKLLNQQAGVVNFAPLKESFMAIFQASKSYLSCTALTPPLVSPIQRQWDEDLRQWLPAIIYTPEVLIAKLQTAYPIMTQGKFNEALASFRAIVHQALLTVVQNDTESSEIAQLISVCREYILGISIETERKVTTEPKRAVELAAYFTHCELQTIHLQLSIRQAMVQSFKLKNYGTAMSFAQRLLEQGPSPQVAASAKKILQHCERNSNNEVELNYDQYNPFVMCCESFTPIYQGSSSIQCPYCQSHYLPEYEGIVCKICQLCSVGATTTGIVRINHH
ncbi:coatomer WD associated region-domain-containing protein [Globomyces pollinis-pini]|nr:coatomer WD associated region-domain-containing protein [Globomyces pollinis-pini]